MRGVRVAWLVAVAVFAARSLAAQVTFLQNDDYTSGAVSCRTGFSQFAGLAAKFTAAPGQYPYTINRIRIFGCGSGSEAYGVQIYADNGDNAAPGALIWSGDAYQLSGGNVYNDILMANEPTPPPPIASGSIRVYLINHLIFGSPMGFGADTSGIQAHRNYLVSDQGTWSFAENGGVTGDWIIRVGIDTAATADVSVAITDGQTQAVPGQPVTYTVVAANAGPDAVTGAKVTATLPPALLNATWTCTPSAGSSCAATGTGNISDTVGLLSSGTLTYSLTATIDPAATGSLTNTVAIALAAGATDPTPANNTASDTDTLTPRADLSVAVLDSPDPVAPSGTLTYTVQAANLGPSTSTGMTLANTLPAGVSFVSVTPAGPTCTVAASVVTCQLGGLAPAASHTVTIVVGVGSSTGTLSDTATVTGTETDLVSGNNSDTETTTVSVAPPGVRFYTVTPCRVVDTRGTLGVPIGGPALGAQIPRVFVLGGRCNVPTTAKAVSANVTVTSPGADGNLRLYPGGLTLPLVSTLNYSAGQTRANNAVIVLNENGEINVFAAQALGTTVEVILDVNGYFQ